MVRMWLWREFGKRRQDPQCARHTHRPVFSLQCEVYSREVTPRWN